MKKSLFISILSLLLSATAIADYRVATLDMSRVLSESTEAKAAKAQLDAASDKAKKLIEDKKAALKPLEDKAKAGKLDPNSKEASQFKKNTQELFTLIREKEDELRKEFTKANKALTGKTVQIVEKYAKEHDIQIVLDKSEKGRSPVLFRDASFDITDDIVKLIN